jgi:hypothetical protein
MNVPRKEFFSVFGGLNLMLLILFPVMGYADEVSYDKYTAIYEPGRKSPSTAEKLALNFLTYPFELLRWPTNKGIAFSEEHHLLDKTRWVFDTMQDYGITPDLGLTSAGVTVDFIRLARQKVKYPDFTTQGWIHFGHHKIFHVGTKIGLERIGGTGLRTFGVFDYQNRPEEHFYGIGPDTSKGQGTSYKMEATTLEYAAGYSTDPSFAGDMKVAYRNVNITNGEDGGRGIIDTTFPNQTIDGLAGDEIISIGPELIRDTRNQKNNSTKGSLLRAAFSFNEGLYSSRARYFKYIAEGSKYLRLGSDRRVLAVHFYGEHNNEARGHYVPFHQMARLGGYGRIPDEMSHPLRAYDENRFYGETAALLNVEYRYNVYEYRDWKADAVLFWDEGQAFNDLSDFQLQDFRESYGVGLRISVLNHVVLSFEVAHGDEGTNFYAKSGTPF